MLEEVARPIRFFHIISLKRRNQRRGVRLRVAHHRNRRLFEPPRSRGIRVDTNYPDIFIQAPLLFLDEQPRPDADNDVYLRPHAMPNWHIDRQWMIRWDDAASASIGQDRSTEQLCQPGYLARRVQCTAADHDHRMTRPQSDGSSCPDLMQVDLLGYPISDRLHFHIAALGPHIEAAFDVSRSGFSRTHCDECIVNCPWSFGR